MKPLPSSDLDYREGAFSCFHRWIGHRLGRSDYVAKTSRRIAARSRCHRGFNWSRLSNSLVIATLISRYAYTLFSIVRWTLLYLTPSTPRYVSYRWTATPMRLNPAWNLSRAITLRRGGRKQMNSGKDLIKLLVFF